ncbi:hypothetical protein [Ornithinimicrobium kibberense]|uniref:hypothetical protein n=1 Tax=Ornithinimicrobium kibberense TaxID=282060 RepID=UPI00361713DA
MPSSSTARSRTCSRSCTPTRARRRRCRGPRCWVRPVDVVGPSARRPRSTWAR